MGGFFEKLFYGCSKQNEEEKEFKQIDDNIKINKLKDEDNIKEYDKYNNNLMLCLKIHIVGKGENK